MSIEDDAKKVMVQRKHELHEETLTNCISDLRIFRMFSANILTATLWRTSLPMSGPHHLQSCSFYRKESATGTRGAAII